MRTTGWARTHTHFIDEQQSTHENHINWENQPSRISQKKKIILLERFSIVDSVERRRNPRWNERARIKPTTFIHSFTRRLFEKRSLLQVDSAGEREAKRIQLSSHHRIIQLANCLAIAGRIGRLKNVGNLKSLNTSAQFCVCCVVKSIPFKRDQKKKKKVYTKKISWVCERSISEGISKEQWRLNWILTFYRVLLIVVEKNIKTRKKGNLKSK